MNRHDRGEQHLHFDDAENRHDKDEQHLYFVDAKNRYDRGEQHLVDAMNRNYRGG